MKNSLGVFAHQDMQNDSDLPDQAQTSDVEAVTS